MPNNKAERTILRRMQRTALELGKAGSSISDVELRRKARLISRLLCRAHDEVADRKLSIAHGEAICNAAHNLVLALRLEAKAPGW